MVEPLLRADILLLLNKSTLDRSRMSLRASSTSADFNEHDDKIYDFPANQNDDSAAARALHAVK